MDAAAAYMPMDRRQALAGGQPLPERAQGTALFADISGFTPLTEALARELGPSRGAEELTLHLNRVYDALIAELHRFGGSVISLSGDAITCWLDGDDGPRATACALAMQEAMSSLTSVETSRGTTVSLGIKVAVTRGSVRRFTVGDPGHCLLEAMAGNTLDRLATAEQLAQTGEVILDTATAASLGDGLDIEAWRIHPETGLRCAVVRGLSPLAPPDPWPALPTDALTMEQIRGWLLPSVLQRLETGQGEFLAELRPAVALFMQFGGIDYDHDPSAGNRLDQFVREVQTVLGRYGASLLNLTIGDKGSYLFACFGAPITHEDDGRRAADAALELQALSVRLSYVTPIRIGIASGRMRTGAYGSSTRRTYSALGDAVNFAARLMAAAGPDQILVSESLQARTSRGFVWRETQPIRVKGMREPVSVAELTGRNDEATIRLLGPPYALPMVGRQAEVEEIAQKMGLVFQGKGQIVGITAEAGVGKSRLAAQAVHRARSAGMRIYGGECQSYGMATSYLVWRSIWRALFQMDTDAHPEDQIRVLTDQLDTIDPQLVLRLPLLGTVLNIPVPENDLTRNLEAKVRKSSLEALLVDCLRARARESPLLLVLEDCHWLDPLSRDLIEEISRAIVELPVLLLLVYRPWDTHGIQPLRATRLSHFGEIVLSEFTAEEAGQLIRLKLERLSSHELEVPDAVVALLTERASGNPFYLEELLNYLRDRGIDATEEKALKSIELPSSLHSLILSRMDQLTESQQATIRVASVIGRLFRAGLVWGAYPQLGSYEQVKRDLDVLSELDIAPLDSPEPELAYMFKHILTQEVAYESLLHATRAMLHERIGLAIEEAHAGQVDQQVDLLAFHYERSKNLEKKQKYLLRAAEAARLGYANEAAIDYYAKVVSLLETAERRGALINLGKVLELTGQWDAAERRYEEARVLASETADLSGQAWCETSLGELYRKQGRYEQASQWLTQARARFEALGDEGGVGQVLHYGGMIADQQGDSTSARVLWEQSLAIRRRLDDLPSIGGLLSNLGIVAARQGDLGLARGLLEESLAVRRSTNDRWAIAVTLNNIGFLALLQSRLEEARPLLEEALALQREVGDRWMIGNALNNRGNVARDQAEFDEAHALYAESLSIYRLLGDKGALAYLLEDIGRLAALQGHARQALCLAAAASALRDEVGAPLSTSEAEQLDAALACARDALGADAKAAWVEGLDMELSEVITYALGLASRKS